MKRRQWIMGGSAVATVAAAGLLWLVSVREAPIDAPAVAAPKNAGFIPLRSDQIRALGIAFAVARPAETVPIAVLPAQIVPPPNARVAVAAQLPGVVTRVFVVDGQTVRAGQTLATVASRDMVGLTAELARARSRQATARASAARLGQLAREGIIAPARSDEASALARQSDIDVGEQSRLISLAHGGSGGGAGYVLTAPISGRISGMTAETGKALDIGMSPFVIDGDGPLQVTAQLPERLLGIVHPDMRIRVGANGVGRILAVGGSIDPATRSATVTATLDSAGGIVAGSATSVSVDGPAPAGAVRIPASAITTLDGRAVVFVIAANGVRVQPVRVIDGTGDPAIVLDGLKPGERVVTSGVSELKTLASAN